MSNPELLKAELKARRSTRELEHSLDHLGIKLEEGVEKAQVLRERANEVVTKIKHPRETFSRYASERGHVVMDSVRDRVDRISPQSRPILMGLMVGSYILGMFLMGRRKRRIMRKVAVIPMEQVRIFVEAA